MPVVRVRGSNPWVPRPRPSQKGAGMCSMRPPAAHEVRLSTGPWCRSLVHPLVSGRRGRKWVRSPPSCQPRWVTGSEDSQGAGISDLDPPFAPPDRLHAAPSSSSRACSTMTASWTSATAAAKMAQGAQQHPTYGRGLCRFSRPFQAPEPQITQTEALEALGRNLPRENTGQRGQNPEGQSRQIFRPLNSWISVLEGRWRTESGCLELARPRKLIKVLAKPRLVQPLPAVPLSPAPRKLVWRSS